MAVQLGLSFSQTLIAGAAGGTLPLVAGLIREVAETKRQRLRAYAEMQRSTLEQRRDRAYELIALVLAMHRKLMNARMFTPTMQRYTEVCKTLRPEDRPLVEEKVREIYSATQTAREGLQIDWERSVTLAHMVAPGSSRGEELRQIADEYGQVLGIEQELEVAGTRGLPTKADESNLPTAMTKHFIGLCRGIADEAQAGIDALLQPKRGGQEHRGS